MCTHPTLRLLDVPASQLWQSRSGPNKQGSVVVWEYTCQQLRASHVWRRRDMTLEVQLMAQLHFLPSISRLSSHLWCMLGIFQAFYCATLCPPSSLIVHSTWNVLIVIFFPLKSRWQRLGGNSLMQPGLGHSPPWQITWKNDVPGISVGKSWGAWGCRSTALHWQENQSIHNRTYVYIQRCAG